MAKWPRWTECNKNGAYLSIWRSSKERDDVDKALMKYLRADTCTPNEKLEELIREIEQEIMSQAGPNDYGNAVRTMGKFVIKRLREVMK